MSIKEIAAKGNDPTQTASAFRDIVSGPRVRTVPAPGHGTWERFQLLAEVAEGSPAVARLVEGHLDAIAILAELDVDAPPDAVLGVWAAEPDGEFVSARRQDAGWSLTGNKPFASGCRTLTHALVTARTGEERLLFLVELAGNVLALDGTWPAVGMTGTDSATVVVRASVADDALVAGTGRYLTRPGFWHGAAGVAACWLGGAYGVAAPLFDAIGADPHVDAHAGAVDAALAAAGALLRHVAAKIDADPLDERQEAELWALRLRAAVESAASTTLARVGRALGAGPLCRDAAHARRVADLTVYLRQSHAESDLARLAHVRSSVAG